MFRGSIEEMVGVWSGKEEYSHGFFIPFITLYLIWTRRAELTLVSKFKESRSGLAIGGVGFGGVCVGYAVNH